VSGSSNTAVTWSTTDGSVSAAGLYTAPTVSANTNATVTATSEANSSVYASASITIDATTTGINPKNYGATGNGTTDDTAAINQAIAALTPGDELSFPCGTYLVTSTPVVNVANVTVTGNGCATIHNTGGGQLAFALGTSNGNPVFGTAVPLAATASEGATSFTTTSSLGVGAGAYVLLNEGGEDFSTDTPPGTPTGCDVSACRGEIVEIASVSGNTYTVTTSLHDTYNPSVNGATAAVMTATSGMTIENITIDGDGTSTWGLVLAGVVNTTVSNVTAENIQGAAIYAWGGFGNTISSITITASGSDYCGAALLMQTQGNLTISTASVSNLNAAASSCLGGGGFGFEVAQIANSTFSNVTVNASGATGRAFKTAAVRHSTFNKLVVENDNSINTNGIEYYSSWNVFNGGSILNNGAGTGTGTGNAGITTFGNFNQNNTFENMTFSGNGNVQLFISKGDALGLAQDSGNIVIGGTYTGSNTSEPVILIEGAGAYITSAAVNGPASQGIYLGSTSACVNNNTFGGGSGLGAGIQSTSSSNMGANNVLNGASSDLTAGTCTGP
jgi:hypothetical protein